MKQLVRSVVRGEKLLHLMQDRSAAGLDLGAGLGWFGDAMGQGRAELWFA